MFCRRTQHSVPGQGSNLDRSLGGTHEATAPPTSNRLILKQLDYEIEISMRDNWLMLHGKKPGTHDVIVQQIKDDVKTW